MKSVDVVELDDLFVRWDDLAFRSFIIQMPSSFYLFYGGPSKVIWIVHFTFWDLVATTNENHRINILFNFSHHYTYKSQCGLYLMRNMLMAVHICFKIVSYLLYFSIFSGYFIIVFHFCELQTSLFYSVNIYVTEN